MKSNKYGKQLLPDNESYKPITVVIIVLVIIFILVGFYFLTNIILNNQHPNETLNEAVIQNDKIIFGQLLSKKDNDYYVIAYDKTTKFADLYNNYLNKYKEKENSFKVYEIDLNDSFNKKYVGDQTNIEDDITKIMVSDDVLFKIHDGKIDNYFVGSSEINKYLKKVIEG